MSVMFNNLVPSSCLCLCTPPQLCLCCYIISPPLHLCCVHKLNPSHSFHLPQSISFILSTIAHVFLCIDYSPSLSYLPYLVIIMLHSHSSLLSRLIKQDFSEIYSFYELTSGPKHQSLISQT